MNEHVKRGTAFDPTWSDPDAAVKFLKALRPNGPWAVTAIYPDDAARRPNGDVGPAPSRTFDDATKLRSWIALRCGVANLYFTANSTKALDKKPSETDVVAVEFVHVDIDEDEQGPLAGDMARKGAVVDRLRSFPLQPSVIVDSGGGIQALWRLAGRNNTPAEMRECKDINAWLIESHGGDPGTHNLDRLLRLPGTPNLPDARKRKRGRVPLPARLIDSNAKCYERWEFPSEPRDHRTNNVDIEIGEAITTEDLDALARKYGLATRLIKIIRDGSLPEPKKPDNSRSVWVFDALCGLIRAKVPNEIILGLVTDPRWAISESVLEKDNAERQIKSAHEAIQRERGSVDDGNETGSDWPRPLGYALGKKINAVNGRIFVRARPGRLVTSDGVVYGLNPDGVWRSISEPELRAEIRATNPDDSLDVHNVKQMVSAVADLTYTVARPFDWVDPPPSAPAPKDLVLFRNGVLNLVSNELMPLDGSYFATAVPAFDYDPDATCPYWLSWLDERLDASFHPTLQEWIGYVMVPDTTAHRFATFTGPPRSGKSTSKNIIEQLVGSDHISRKQLADMGKEFGLQDTVDKRLIVIPDAKDAPANQRGPALERILAVTGGDITGIPRKYLSAMSVKLLTRLLVLGNRQPAWIDESGALAARQIAIIFDRSFEGREDQGVEDRLMRELPGIANWALDGLKRLRANKYKFTIGEAGKVAVAEVRRSASPALRFADDCLDVTGHADDMVLIDDVYRVYENWASEEGLRGIRNKTDLISDLETSLHNVRQTQTRKLAPPPNWAGGEYRPRVLTGVRSVRDLDI